MSTQSRAGAPERIDDSFATALNAGDLDGLMRLYEADASLMPSPGHIVRGTAAIRDALSQFIATKPSMTIGSRTLAQSGDIALVSANWRLEMAAAEGGRAMMTGQSVEVVRRQNDGSWRFVIDFPFGVG